MPHKDPEKRKVWRKKYREENKDKIRLKEKEYYHTIHKFKSHIKNQQAAHRRTIKNRFIRAKKRAEYKNVIWLLTLEEFSEAIRLPCIYCNNNLSPPSEVGIGLDQLIAGNGYVMGNIGSCCYTCNRIKGDDLSIEETKAAIQAILVLRKNNGKN